MALGWLYKLNPHARHQHCTDEAQKAETVLSALIGHVFGVSAANVNIPLPYAWIASHFGWSWVVSVRGFLL